MADRYVDDKGKPLPYTPEYPYAKHPCDEFKRMPVHLSFVMDQRRLPKLLVECPIRQCPSRFSTSTFPRSPAAPARQAGRESLGPAAPAGAEAGGGPSASDDREVEIRG